MYKVNAVDFLFVILVRLLVQIVVYFATTLFSNIRVWFSNSATAHFLYARVRSISGAAVRHDRNSFINVRNYRIKLENLLTPSLISAN